MIALILNGICGDDEFIQQIIGLFNDESDIPDEYKRTEYLKEELLQCRTPLTKRFLNKEEYAEFENNFDPFKYRYGHPSFYSIKSVNVGEIMQWIEKL